MTGHASLILKCSSQGFRLETARPGVSLLMTWRRKEEACRSRQLTRFLRYEAGDFMDDDGYVSTRQICEKLHAFKGAWWTQGDIRRVVRTSSNSRGPRFEIRYTDGRASHVRAAPRALSAPMAPPPHPADNTAMAQPPPGTNGAAASRRQAVTPMGQPPPGTPADNTESMPVGQMDVAVLPPPSLTTPPPPPPPPPPPAAAHQPLRDQVKCVFCRGAQPTHAFIHCTESRLHRRPGAASSLIAHVLICSECRDLAEATNPESLRLCPACRVDCWGVASVL